MTGRNIIKLADYLNDYPLTFKTTDDKMITKDEISVGNPDAISFSSDSIKVIEWDNYNTDVSLEVKSGEGESDTIQDTSKEFLLENDLFSYVIFDHAKGEIADFIALEEKENKFKLSLFH